MRLKEIKPGMVIHCKTLEEMKELSKHIHIPFNVDSVWKYGSDCINFESESITTHCHLNHFVKNNYEITEFSDLIIPEMTAYEVIKTLGEIKGTCAIGKMFCCGCPLHDGNNRIGLDLCDFENFVGNEEVVIEICAEWKADHEKKSLEIETVDICRIIEILPDGRKRCMHEEDIKSELPFGGDERQKVEEILKHYCMEHDGEYIAVHEVVSRVKAVE